MKKYPALFLLFLLCILWLLFSLCIASAAEALFEKESEDTLELTLNGILEQSDQQALDDLVSNTGLPRSVTFSGLGTRPDDRAYSVSARNGADICDRPVFF